jgi:hypothetical protein
LQKTPGLTGIDSVDPSWTRSGPLDPDTTAAEGWGLAVALCCRRRGLRQRAAVESPEFTESGVPGLSFSWGLAWEREETMTNSMDGSGRRFGGRRGAHDSVAPTSNRGGGMVQERGRKGWRRRPPPREALAAACH